MKYNRNFIMERTGCLASVRHQRIDLAMWLTSDKKLMKIWRKAEDIDAFLREIRSSKDNEIKFSNFATYYYGVVRHDYAYRKEFINTFASEVIITTSDGGSLKVGSDGFSVKIRNHYGDGHNKVAIFNKQPFGDVSDNRFNNLFPYSDVTVEGKEIKVYDYDCGEEAAVCLHGTYHIYSDEKTFAVVKWGE